MARKKTIEEKYIQLSEQEHILARPGMWIGSTKEEEKLCFIYNSEENKMEMQDIVYAPAMLKLFDEVLSNSCDEYRRKDNMGLTKVDVSVNQQTGQIRIYDNGGIPVKKHKDSGSWVSEFIFGQLRTSSNYDDTEDRNVIGTNGVGSSLTNIFSKEFVVKTADKKKSILTTWRNNMSEKDPEIVDKCDDHFTDISFVLDFSRFTQQKSGITNDFIKILYKRCIDAAAANPKLTVTFKYTNEHGKQFKETKWKFNKFSDYMTLYNDYFDETSIIELKDQKKHIWVCPGSQIDVAFVNGAECSRGTHLRAVRKPIDEAIIKILKKKHKIDVTSRGIDGKYGIFGLFDISNPAYNSQTKEELTTSQEDFYKEGAKFNLTKDFIEKCSNSEIIDLVVDWFKKKSEAEDAAKIRKLNREAKKLLRSDKYIDCNSRKRAERELWIYEGDSAAASHRTARDPMRQAGYLMRGVPLNAIGMSATQVMKNHVFNDIVNIIGLQWGQYNKAEDLKFSKIIIASDADPDGDKIASLLIVFFNHFPELFDQGLINRVISPIVIASKGRPGTRGYVTESFYSQADFKKEEKKFASKGYDIKHVKGLGTMNTNEFKKVMSDPILYTFTKDDMADMMLRKWFGKDAADARKGLLKSDLEI